MTTENVRENGKRKTLARVAGTTTTTTTTVATTHTKKYTNSK